MFKYGESKSQRNIFNRYPLLKIMIKVSLKYLKKNIHNVFKTSAKSALLGSNSIRNPILDVSGDTKTGEAGNGARLRDASVCHHGENAKIW